MYRKFLFWGTALSGLAVILGAFAAHGLKAIIPADKIAIFETGVRYQFMHAFALIIVSFFIQQNKSNQALIKKLSISGSLFLVGIMLFSGSLFALAIQPLIAIQYAKFIGPVTPIGGVCFVAGWFIWASAAYFNKVDN